MHLLDAAKVEPLRGGPSFSRKNRLTRLVWNISWFLLARWTPAFCSPWRVILLRTFGAKIAPGAAVSNSINVWLPQNLEMGTYATLGPGVDCYNMALITIGAYSVISQRTVLCAGTHSISDPNFQLVTKPICVGESVWLAAETFVGPGVNIGDGAVLGARACAFSSIESNSVYIGNPARKIKNRIFQSQ